MIGIIDYGVGNLFSLKSSFKYIGVSADLVSDEKGIRACEKLILPGVGAFGDAADALKKSGLDRVIKAVASEGKPLMGICLGMQLLFEKGLEFGEHDGLGLIPGTVVPIQPLIKDNKIPHIGWNKLEFTEQRGDIYKYTADGDFVYFVHSYPSEFLVEFVTARS